MKFRRMISLITAVSISASVPAGMAVLAEETEDTVSAVIAAESESYEEAAEIAAETEASEEAEPDAYDEANDNEDYGDEVYDAEEDIALFADTAEAFTVDFTKLTASEYAAGTAAPLVINDYLSVYFTNGGSIDSSGLHLLGENKGRGAYTKGSYVEFTAPCAGKLSFSGSAVNYYIDGTYTGYANSLTLDVTEKGTKYQFAQRTTTNITSLSFTPAEATPEPTVAPPTPNPYTAPSTVWDFADYAPAQSGVNMPYISGNAVYDKTAGEVQFPADTTAAGYLSVNFDAPIAHSANYDSAVISFDVTGHSKTLGQQYFGFKLSNSEGAEIVDFSCHPGSSDTATYGSNYVNIGGTAVNVAPETVRSFSGTVGEASAIEIAVDYKGGTITLKHGADEISGSIPEALAKDIAKFEFSVTRSKTAADRYISFDNLKITESKSTAQSSRTPSIAEGYEEKTFGGINSRVKAPAGDSLSLLIYLCGSSRFGTDNYSQLYNAQYLFDLMDGKAILAAPQTYSGWDTGALKAYIEAAKKEYNPSQIVVAGQFEGADAAYSLADTADKVIAIAGTSDITSAAAKIWAFGGFLDDVTSIADIRKPVNSLQKAKADVRYTEYPTDGHNIAEKAVSEEGLSDWILNNEENKKVVDLVLFSGQSNMAGRGSAGGNDKEPAAVSCPPGQGYQFHSITNPSLADGEVPYVLSTVTEPFGKTDNNSVLNDSGSNGIDRRSGDMAAALMKAYYEKTGVPIVGVQASRGGQESSFFVNSAINNEMLARYNAAAAYLKSAGYTVRRKFMVWVQGEADADKGRAESAYKSNTLKVFTNMQTAGITDMFIIKTGHYNINYGLSDGASPSADALALDAKYKQINTWQQEIADSTENVYTAGDLYTDAYLNRMRDQYHFYQDVYNEVGSAAGAGIAETYSQKALKASDFEITSSDASIDVSKLKSYGADTYRVYKSDKSYYDIKALNGIVENTTGTEVTVVPVYRFNYTSAAMDGYTTATNTYSASAGYGLISGGSYSTNADGSYPEKSPLRIDVPEGRYDIKILRKNQTRCNVFNDGVKIMTNDGVSGGNQNRPMTSALMYAPQVLNSDGSLDITIGGVNGSSLRIAAVEAVRVPEKYKKQVVWIAGDSESANYYPIDADGDDLLSQKIMMTGFGMQLQRFLPENKYKVSNFGEPSSTAVTWYSNHFEHIYQNMDKGDIIIADFGINDGNKKIGVDVMKAKLKEIFEAAKAKGVQPILVSPIWNSKYQHKTYFTYSADSKTNDMYDFAAECDVPCIDLNKGTMAYKDNAIKETGDSDWVTHNYHVGDSLHQTQFSSILCAAIIAGGMKSLGYDTTDYSLTYKDISSFDASDNTKRGTESGVTREYSISALSDYVTVEGAQIKAEPTPASTPIPTPTASPKTVEISGNTVTVNLDNVTSAVIARIAYTDDGRLVGIKTYPIILNDGKASQTVSELGNNDVIVVWKSINDMEPLAPKTKASIKTETTTAPTAAVVYTAKPSASPEATVSATDEPTTILYSQDFESFSEGDTAGWTSPAGTMSIKSDAVSGIGKYQTVVSGKSGTCRSGYVEIPAVNQNFVFECDYKSTSNVNVSDLELVSDKSAVYANHGLYSNKNAVFTMARPSGSDVYVINNAKDDSGYKLESYAKPAVTSAEISSNPWLHVKVIGNFNTHTVEAYITSLDKKTEYYHGITDMIIRDPGNPISSWKCIHLLSPSTGADTCIDNIIVRTPKSSELGAVCHTVAIDNGINEFSQYVIDGKAPVNIPDVSVYGSYFQGWSVNGSSSLITSAQLSSLPITADAKITAAVSSEYKENLASVEFKDFPAGNELAMGADENTYGDNTISLAILGEKGTSLVTNPDSRVTDYKIEWTFDGFRTLDGKPTGETGNVYCDSYGLIEITEDAQSSVSFKLKKTAANYYGRVKAKVTYNGKSIEAEKPLVLLGDKSSAAMLPKAGYTADFNKYESSMVGYRAASNDVVIGGWRTDGSDSTYMDIKSDSTGKYLSLSRALSGNSSYVYNTIGQITSQTVFEQDIRFGAAAVVSYMDGAVTASANTAFKLAYSDGALTLNDTKICSANGTTWYHIVITADPTSKLCNARVYSMDGTMLGKTENIAFDSTYKSGNYYRIATAKAKGTVDVNNIKIYEAEIDSDTFEITAADTASIPSTVSLTAAAKTTSGDDAIGIVQWAIDDELADGVSIKSAGNNSASLTITDSASSGDIPIKATIGGKSVTKTIKLTGKAGIGFTQAPAGIQLGNAAEYTYKAEVRNANAEPTADAVTYSLSDASGAAASVRGVTIDALTGKLSVAANAAPQTIYIKASSSSMSKLAKTVLYSLKFSFGTNAAASGYTQVTSSSAYSSAKGFGLEGAAVDEASDITGGGVTFKVRLERGRVYNVKAEYQGTIRCERINDSFPGFDRTQTYLARESFDVAVFGDDIMDITLLSGGKLASIEITPVTKTAPAKPDWWTIGDSTVQQNGSWGYTIASDSTTNLSKYPELAEVISGFHNSGRAGRQHKSFYTEGLLNAILTKMNPGDIVSISGMGTNDSSSTQAQFKEYDRLYVNAVIDMGGKVILGSYTPSGNYGAAQGKVYDTDTMTFKGTRTNSYDLAIRELALELNGNEQYLGFIDIGKMADDMMTADVAAAYASGGVEAANAKAEEMMAWWKDYNHYYTTFSNYLLPSLTKAAAELIAK